MEPGQLRTASQLLIGQLPRDQMSLACQSRELLAALPPDPWRQKSPKSSCVALASTWKSPERHVAQGTTTPPAGHDSDAQDTRKLLLEIPTGTGGWVAGWTELGGD